MENRKDPGTLGEAIELMTSQAEELFSVDREDFHSLLFESGGVRSLGGGILGCTDVAKHWIDTANAAPI